MSIRPDWWIRQRAHDGMIEPFVEHLEAEGVISYGLSSFGYDVRAAAEWRVFVNAFNTMVDPKAFSTDSFVEVEADHCIIPPNSFALTRSVEYLRVPDDVMVVALGKSSYARCFRGDTRVALVDGSAPTLEEMAARGDAGEKFLGYALGRGGGVIVARLEAPRYVGRDELVEVTLDDGAAIHCTPDHRFLTRDGGSAMACELTSGSSLMPLYRTVARGYEMTYAPHTGRAHPTHRLTEAWRRRHGLPQPDPAWQRGDCNAAPYLGHLNHRVASVRTLAGEEDVYCLTVPEAGNFALEAGVFVHNCGIVANVTPLEPGWEGHVTLELSNTTPLPAKVYADEGIVQLLFFQGERPDVTYGDRKGKYQGQRGVTLPRL